MADRYEISVLVGPCEESEVEDAMVAIAELLEVQGIGGAVASRLWDEAGPQASEESNG